MRNKLIFILLLIAAVAPTLALAEPTAPAGYALDERLLPNGPQSILGFIRVISNLLFTILLVLAVFFLLLAAYNYMGGSEEGVAKAHRMLLYTAVAVAVAVLSYGIVNAVQILVAGRAQG